MKKNKTNLNAIDSRIYKYWQALYMSFYSRQFYLDVGKRWRGYGFTYFLLVIAIAVIPVSIRSMHIFNDYYEYQVIEPFKKIPSFAIKRGKLDFDYFMPYLVKNKFGEVAVVIDDKNNLTEVNYIYPYWMLFITSDRFYFRLPTVSFLSEKVGPMFATLNSKHISMQPFSGVEYDIFNGQQWAEQTRLMNAKWFLLAAIYPILLGLLFGFFSMIILFMAILGRGVSYVIFKYKLDFKKCCRLMFVSSGTGVSLFILCLTFGRLPLTGLGLFGLISLYFGFAVLSLKRESKRMVLA